MTMIKTKTPLAHFHVFPWNDDNEVRKTKASILDRDRELMRAIAPKIEALLKKGFIYQSNAENHLRMSEGIAKLCAAYVRAGFFSGKYTNSVPKLSDAWLEYKQKHGMLMDVGMANGNMAAKITYFRTNIGDEKNHTGFIVGIKDQTKTGKSSRGGKLTLQTKDDAAKLGWLEYGTNSKGGTWKGQKENTQSPRPVLKIAVHDFLRDYGFVAIGGTLDRVKVRIPQEFLKKNSGNMDLFTRYLFGEFEKLTGK